MLFIFRVCHASSLLVAALWSPAGKALLYVMLSCVFVASPCGVLDQMKYLIVSIPDRCLLTYLNAVAFFLKFSIFIVFSRLKKS